MTKFDDDTLEAAAQLLERMAGNTIYRQAWRAGAKRIRGLKMLTPEKQMLIDEASRPVADAQLAR